MGYSVSLVKSDHSLQDIRDSIRKAVRLIGLHTEKSVKSIVIKPNLCYYWDAATGYTTDPMLVSGIIDFVREEFGSDIKIKVAEADASAMRTRYAFPVLGYEKLAKEKSVELFNLCNDRLIEETVRINNKEMNFKIPQVLRESDLFISVPKLKIMKATGITCAMKNIFGCNGFPKKLVYHPFLNEAIVAINKIIHPHLTIVDGLIGLGRYPMRLGLIMASADSFSVDWVASQIMGYNPSKIKFLKIAIKEGLGNPREVLICGESISKFRKIFPRETFASSKYSWALQFWLLKAYKRIVGDIVPSIAED